MALISFFFANNNPIVIAAPKMKFHSISERVKLLNNEMFEVNRIDQTSIPNNYLEDS